jgi:hypothetical protein
VEYQVTAAIAPPADTPELDALQRIGVAALLDEQLDMLASIEGPDGVEIEPVDHRIGVHPAGALITWLLDAPALAFAEDAAREVLTETLAHTELLTEWTLGRCEVVATDEQLAAALSDPEPDADLDAELAEVTDLTGTPGLTEEERAVRRDRLVEAAGQLQAFGLDAFGHDPEDPDSKVTEEQATLVAGAVVQGLEILTDELFQDIQTLDDAGTPASEHEVLWVLDELPERHADQYTALFAKQFLVVVSFLGYRLCREEWDGPTCTAEALALHLVKSKAEMLLDLAELLDELPADEVFAAFDQNVFDDLDHEWLFSADPAEDSGEDEIDVDAGYLAFPAWFHPYGEDAPALHPYLTDDENSPVADDDTDHDTAEDEDA